MTQRSSTWAQVAQDLSDMKLARLLELSALLSADDALGGNRWADLNSFNGLFPPLLQNFTRAVLESPATYQHTATPSAPFLVRYLVETIGELQNPDGLKRIPEMSLEELVTEVLAPMWRQQVRLDGRHLYYNLFRAYATLVDVPRQIQGDIQARLQDGFIDLDTHIKTTYGCSISTLLLGPLLIYMRYSHVFNSTEPFNPAWLQMKRPDGPQMKLTHDDLVRYVAEASPHLQELYISEDLLNNYLIQYLPDDEVASLLSVLSASVETLRDQLTKPPYSEGMAAYAPLPLELRPLLKMPDGRYLIPNLRSLLLGAGRLPLTLLSTDPARVRLLNNYGQGFEAYVQALTVDRLKGHAITVVHEFEYSHPSKKTAVKSADMTLLEPSQPVTLIEIKATRLPDGGIGQGGTAAFRLLDQKITAAVCLGQDKAQHLTAVLPTPSQGALAATSQERPLVVVVYGEAVAAFSAVFRFLVSKSEHALNPHLGYFLALSIAEYEHHLEMAHERGESVIALLQESAREFANRNELQMTNQTHLGNDWPQDAFVEKFQEKLLAHLKTPASNGTPSGDSEARELHGSAPDGS
ncbi:hypothetical protein [Deinococcus aquatilis]|uniref:hypothetical protein n=1 Tax=Deinococcus aquatilis TaxID=519440 RepID=UPI0012F851C8|nr:hypothetical protein [Deinococcus aquatilis]